MSVTWTTTDEKNYLSIIGTNFSDKHSMHIPPLDRSSSVFAQDYHTVIVLNRKVSMLKKYIDLALMRSDWGSINPVTVLDFARQELSRLEQNLPQQR